MDPHSIGSPPELSALESEVLEEYERLSDNMKKLAAILEDLAANPSTAILEGLRDLERKTSLVYTALKSSVYNMVLQEQMRQQELEREREEADMGRRMDDNTGMDIEWDEGTMQ